MKVEKIVRTIEPVELEITGATLLSEEEANHLLERLRDYVECWWLRSPFSYSSIDADFVYYDGCVYHCTVNYAGISVRPALAISNLASSKLKLGDRFYFDDKEFEIISDTLAFCKTDIGTHCFNKNRKTKDANIYEKSDIKKFVDAWFEKAKSSNIQ